MSNLSRKLFRDLARHLGQVAAVAAIIMMGIVIFSGLLMNQLNIRDSVEEVYGETCYEDFSIAVKSAPSGAVRPLAELDNVRRVQGRLTGDLPGKVLDSRVTFRVIGVPAEGRPAVNDVIVDSGSYFRTGEGAACLVEYHLAGELGVRVGDTVELNAGSGRRELEVIGVVISPEYLRLVGGRTEFVADPASFGVVFVPQQEAEVLFGARDRYNEFLFGVEEGADLAGTMDEAEAALAPYGVISVVRGRDKPGHSMIQLDIDNLRQISVFFSLIVFAVAMLAVFVAVTRLVVSQLRQIGILRALGYERSTIQFHYLYYGLVMGLVGGLMGVAGGFLLTRPFLHLYSSALGLPSVMKVSFHWTIALVSVAVATIVAVLGSFLPARRAARMRPADAIRGEAVLAGDTGRKSKPRLSGMRTWLLMSWRNLFRNPKRTVLTWISLAAVLAVLLTTANSNEAVGYIFDKHLRGIQKWDVAVALSQPESGEILDTFRSIDGVLEVEPAMVFPAMIETDTDSLDVDVKALRKGTRMHGSYPTAGSQAEPEAGQILFGKGILQSLPLQKGEDVTLMTELGPLDLEVAGFLVEPYGMAGYVDLDYIQGLLGGEYLNAAEMTVAAGRQEQVASALAESPGVSKVITEEQTERILDRFMGTVSSFLKLIYVIVLVICFAIIFTMVTINILERRREVATMRALGAKRHVVLGSLMVETSIVTLAAVGPGLLLAWFLGRFLIENLLASSALSPEAVFPAATAALFVLVFLAVTAISGLLPFRQLERMDISSVIKERIG